MNSIFHNQDNYHTSGMRGVNFVISKMIAGDLKVFEKYYDVAKIIDPLAIASSHSPIPCICLQAIRCKETFVKTEVVKGSLLMITAMPMEIDGRIVALELVKCINQRTLENFPIMPDENINMCRSIAKLNDLAFRDALTEIYNRRYIDEQLPMEILQARQCQLPFSIIMADIDYFKQVNDRYGHIIGDEVLKYFATQLQNNIRQNSGDWVARYGGEEFLIVLANCPEGQAYEISEKLRKNIEGTAFPTAMGDLHITSSFGVYTSLGQECELYQLIDKADKYLYEAKQRGRNCTVAAHNSANFIVSGEAEDEVVINL